MGFESSHRISISTKYLFFLRSFPVLYKLVRSRTNPRSFSIPSEIYPFPVQSNIFIRNMYAWCVNIIHLSFVMTSRTIYVYVFLRFFPVSFQLILVFFPSHNYPDSSKYCPMFQPIYVPDTYQARY